MSGGRSSSGDNPPARIAISPSSLRRVRQIPSQARPRDRTANPQPGIAGTASCAPGSAVVIRATPITSDAPQPIGTSARRSNPSGISARPNRPAGMTQNAVSGTATMFDRM